MEETTQFVSKAAENLIHQLISNLDLNEYSVSLIPATSRGDNFLGIVEKVKIKTKNAVKHWILKCAVQIEEFRKLCFIPTAYAREVYIYEKVLTEFELFQMEKGIKNPFQSYAKYHGSLLDAPNECLVMEDMKELGYQLIDRQCSLDYDHAMIVIREYARFHALSFALRDQKPSVFEEISKNTQNFIFKENTDYMIDLVNTYIDRILKVKDRLLTKSACEKFQGFKKHALPLIQKIIGSEVSGKYSVLCHSDSWVNNLLFKYSNSAKPNVPTELCFIDWQLSHMGSPVLDLSYFLFTCTDQQFRKMHYNDALKIYYDTFSKFLRKLGSNPEELFPLSVLDEHLKVFSVFGLYMSMQILYTIFSSADEIVDYCSENLFKEIQYTSKNVQNYYARMQGVILDFDRLGYEL